MYDSIASSPNAHGPGGRSGEGSGGSSSASNSEWVFLATLDRLQPGESLAYRTAAGDRLTLTRRGSAGTPDDFCALAGACPHSGGELAAPEHAPRAAGANGTSRRDGAREALSPACALKIESGLLYVQVPIRRLTSALGAKVAFLVEDPGASCARCAEAQR
jgi:hypothetical protein